MSKNTAFKKLFNEMPKHLIIAGPCSAESEMQVLETAKALKEKGVHLFRAGIWKPRTRPNSFEGIGTEGLKWLQKAKKEIGIRTTTEVANANHVDQALKHEVDVLWIGARTTVNPFTVQEIVDALKGTDTPVIIKNPINPDLKLWMGAIERFLASGINRIAALHRGFSFYGESKYRNVPRWQIVLDLMSEYPELPVMCDISHISGNRTLLPLIAQKALDLNYNGLMVEVHPNPDEAWSDAKQQITPEGFKELLDSLVFREQSTADIEFQRTIEHYRHRIDEIDEDIIQMLGTRMEVVRKIGKYKLDQNISIFQPNRWSEILETAVDMGKNFELSEKFILTMLKAIHQESINHQEKIMIENNPIIKKK